MSTNIVHQRLGGVLKPGNLSGSCVRDSVARDFFEIIPRLGVMRVPLGLVLTKWFEKWFCEIVEHLW